MWLDHFWKSSRSVTWVIWVVSVSKSATSCSKTTSGAPGEAKWLRNTRGATAVAPYSTRALPTATVSVPLHWDELGPKEDLRSRFTITTVPQRVESVDDPWAGFFAAASAITAETIFVDNGYHAMGM